MREASCIELALAVLCMIGIVCTMAIIIVAWTPAA